jgi:hypothetical protein
MFLFYQKKFHLAEIVGFCIIGEIKKSFFKIFQKEKKIIFLWSVITFLINLAKTQNSDLFISPTNKSHKMDFFLVKKQY